MSEVATARATWFVRSGEDAVRLDEFLERGVVSVGFVGELGRAALGRGARRARRVDTTTSETARAPRSRAIGASSGPAQVGPETKKPADPQVEPAELP